METDTLHLFPNKYPLKKTLNLNCCFIQIVQEPFCQMAVLMFQEQLMVTELIFSVQKQSHCFQEPQNSSKTFKVILTLKTIILQWSYCL